jgi:peptidoglycan/LPS O-acetylase OafA/YrhL
LRTWPIYYLLIALLIVLSPVLARPYCWSSLPFALTYTQGVSRLWGGTREPFNPCLAHTWSLAVEEQFYLVWPVLVILTGRGRLALLALACAGGSVLARSQGIWSESLVAQADGLALGGWLAALRLPSRQPAGPAHELGRTTWVVRLAALGALAFLGTIAVREGLLPRQCLRAYPGLTVLAFNLLWLGLIDHVLTHSGQPRMRLLRLRLFQRLGQISYSLYLYHYPILLITLDLARGLGVTGKLYGPRLLAILVTLPVAELSWRFIEGPVLELKRRYSYRPRSDRAGHLRADRPDGNRRSGPKHVDTLPLAGNSEIVQSDR